MTPPDARGLDYGSGNSFSNGPGVPALVRRNLYWVHEMTTTSWDVQA